MMGHREKLDAAEEDAFSSGGRAFRHYIVWNGRRKKIKKTFTRRIRHKEKQDLKEAVK